MGSWLIWKKTRRSFWAYVFCHLLFSIFGKISHKGRSLAISTNMIDFRRSGAVEVQIVPLANASNEILPVKYHRFLGIGLQSPTQPLPIGARNSYTRPPSEYVGVDRSKRPHSILICVLHNKVSSTSSLIVWHIWLIIFITSFFSYSFHSMTYYNEA